MHKHVVNFVPHIYRYDPERVPALPVQLEERKQHSTLNDYYVKFSGDQMSSKGSGSSEQSMDRENRELTTSLSEVVDVQLTRKDSHHFLASLEENTSSMADISLPNKVLARSRWIYMV